MIVISARSRLALCTISHSNSREKSSGKNLALIGAPPDVYCPIPNGKREPDQDCQPGGESCDCLLVVCLRIACARSPSLSHPSALEAWLTPPAFRSRACRIRP